MYLHKRWLSTYTTCRLPCSIKIDFVTTSSLLSRFAMLLRHDLCELFVVFLLYIQYCFWLEWPLCIVFSIIPRSLSGLSMRWTICSILKVYRILSPLFCSIKLHIFSCSIVEQPFLIETFVHIIIIQIKSKRSAAGTVNFSHYLSIILNVI